MRRHKKEKYLTADICIPEKRWKGVPELGFRRYLALAVKVALETCASYLARQKVQVDVHRLLLDYEEVEAKFLNTYQ